MSDLTPEDREAIGRGLRDLHSFSVTVSSSYGRHDADVAWALHSDRPEKRLAELAVLEAGFIRALAVETDRLHREIGNA